LDAMKASRDDFYFLIKDAQRYSELYVNETSLVPAAALSNRSVANALEMRALNGTLKRFEATIEGHNADIYGIAVDNGLNLAQYGNSTALFKAYDAQVDSRLANVTTNVFRTPLLKLSGDKNTAVYGDVVRLSGSLQDSGSGLKNGSVDVYVDNTTVATVPTNASGAYAYQLPIRETAAGSHVAFVKYAPIDAPYNPAQSPPFNFSVATSPVTNSMSVLSSSIALGSDVQARGTLTTPRGPVANGTVLLSMGGSDVASALTDQNGSYSFSVPSLPLYLSALSGGVTTYTVFTPSGLPFGSAASTAVRVPADLTAVYGIIMALVVVALLIVFVYRRGYFRRAPVTKEEVVAPVLPPAKEARPIVAPIPVARVAEAPQRISDWEGVLGEAREAFSRADDENATKALWDAAVTSLAVVGHVSIAAYMTHWEASWAVAAVLRDADARRALRQLTMAYELANFGDRPLTESQREAALSAFASLRSHVSDVEGST